MRDIPIPQFLAALVRRQQKLARRCARDGCGCGNRVHVFLGCDRGHPRRSNFERRLWRPAANGYSVDERVATRKGARGPVPKPKPDWEPIVPGLTPHDLRHSHKTWLIEDGVPEVAQAERLGHKIPGIRGVYSHASDAMRMHIVDALQARWKQSLEHQPRRVRAVR